MKGLVIAVALMVCAGYAFADSGYTDERAALLREITADQPLLSRVLERPQLDDTVSRALNTVPRHAFVPAGQRAHAYENRPLPIGYGQTISQPLIVALMTQLLEPRPGHKVFELGTGSGYQAAVLAHIVDQVYSVEIVPELGARAAETLQRLNIDNVTLRIGDGYFGWPEAAPFDAIVVTAAGDHIPPPLIEQLKPGGRMVIPVGGQYFTQQLMLIHKQADGTIQMRALLPVRFVPLTGDH